MNSLRSWQGIAVSLIVLAGALGLLLLFLPSEKTLGPVVKTVFLHGALVQVGLLTFLAAGACGFVYLLRRRARAYAWCAALQKTAILVWIAYVASSMLATYQAWGQWIAWDEPRVRASYHVLWFSIVALLLARWVDDRRFTAGINIVVAAITWYLIKGSSLVRHPFDPIGESTSTIYRWFFIAMLAVVLLTAVQTARWFRLRMSQEEGVLQLGGTTPSS